MDAQGNHGHGPPLTDEQAMAAVAQTYTCPMHPEVRQPSPGACPKCGMTLVAVKGPGTMAMSVTRHWLVVCVLLAAAGFYLWTEHRAHLLGALPWVILLACPLMHVFMHHGHDGQDGPMDHSGHRHQ